MVYMRMCEIVMRNHIILELLLIKVESCSEEPLINAWVATFPLEDTCYTRTYTGIMQANVMDMHLIFS